MCSSASNFLPPLPCVLHTLDGCLLLVPHAVCNAKPAYTPMSNFNCGIGNPVGQVCESACSPGFIGRPNATCLSTGVWGPTQGTCTRGEQQATTWALLCMAGCWLAIACSSHQRFFQTLDHHQTVTGLRGVPACHVLITLKCVLSQRLCTHVRIIEHHLVEKVIGHGSFLT